MRQNLLLMGFSLLLSGCPVQVERPDTDLCVVNAQSEQRKCFNLLRDYDDDGFILPGAKPIYKPNRSIDDLNKNICIDPDGFERFKAYVKKLRENG